MLDNLFYPQGFLYIAAKLLILLVAVMLWYFVTAAPVV